VPIDGKDNFEPLAAMTWQVHVYGSASAELPAWCAGHDVPLHVFDWRPEHEAAGLARDAIYLVRPDTYVALADPFGTTEVLERYCTDHEIRTLSARLARRDQQSTSPRIAEPEPVKIVMDNPPTDVALGPGMSVEASVGINPNPPLYQRLRGWLRAPRQPARVLPRRQVTGGPTPG
jgi:hypothetical protein